MQDASMVEFSKVKKINDTASMLDTQKPHLFKQNKVKA